MISVESIAELRSRLDEVRLRGKRIGLVPTMGALHRGHLSLVDTARQSCDYVVMSVFVNPIQFNSPQDLLSYPRTLERDLDRAASVGVDLVFAPTEKEIYSDMLHAQKEGPPRECRIAAGPTSRVLEGLHRPGHFDGVVTVVAILFNIVQPDIAVFGEKDFQQVRVIQEMARDLKFRVRILTGPIVRDTDGLALSSRNELLSTEERRRALVIPRTLFAAQAMLAGGVRKSQALIDFVTKEIGESGGLKIDYAAVVNPTTLEPVDRVDEESRLLLAAFVGKVRLIDNVALLPE